MTLKQKNMNKSRKDKKNIYIGEVGEIFQVSYIPKYMQSWPDWKIKIGCWIFNRFPKLEKIIYEHTQG